MLQGSAAQLVRHGWRVFPVEIRRFLAAKARATVNRTNSHFIYVVPQPPIAAYCYLRTRIGCSNFLWGNMTTLFH